MTTEAETWKDSAEIMSLLLELERKHLDFRIEEAKEMTGKAMKDLDRFPVSGPLRTFRLNATTDHDNEKDRLLYCVRRWSDEKKSKDSV